MYGEGERETVSEGWRRLLELSTTVDPTLSSDMDEEEHFCKLILYKEISGSRVRIWDVVILVPNLLFLFFIAIRFNRARLKLRATSSPIFLAFYGLVICNIVISVIRCIVSMTVNVAATVGGKADKVLWVTVRFFLLSTEMSVVIFGLAFGHLDSRSSIRRVLLATSFIALAFTITQGTLELILPDDTFRIPSRDFYVFGHGGMMFWFCSSIVFTMIYLLILILPWTRLRDRLALPTRKSFYVYAGILATLDLIQSVGAGLLNYTQNPIGLCVVDFTAAVYLTLFTPLVYHTFLSEFFGVSQPSIMFSYKAQVDDAMDEDTVSLPHQQSFSSLKTDSDYIYQVHTPSIHMPLYDTQTSRQEFNPKQNTSLYSLNVKKDSKLPSTSQYESLYNSNLKTNPDLRSSPDLGKYHLTKTSNFSTVQKSTPDLSFNNPTWKNNFSSASKLADTTSNSSSITNLLISQNTASNFLYKSKINDSSSNLFSRISKSSLGAGETLNISPPLENILDDKRNFQDQNSSEAESFVEFLPKKRSFSDSESPKIAPLLDEGTVSGQNFFPISSSSKETRKASKGLNEYLLSLKSSNESHTPPSSSRSSDNDRECQSAIL